MDDPHAQQHQFTRNESTSSRKLISVLHPVQLPVIPRSALSKNAGSYVVPIAPPPAALPKPECKPFVRLPEASTKEIFRDITFLGPITLHRIFTLLWIVGSGAALFFVQHWIWPASFSGLVRPDLTQSPVWSWIGVIWLVALPAALASLAGNLLFRYPRGLDEEKPISHNVVFRIVSRGTNAECLFETMQACREAMAADSLFPYLIEVVTDAGVFHAPDEKDLIHLKVPLEYVTPNGTLYKARALHYAAEYSPVPGDTWVVHLDEETRPTSSGIKGIARMIRESEESGKPHRIGQGPMLYHRSWGTFPFLTLADMRRTGDDMGHFHLQHRIGFTLFGMHGSYIVCRQDLEQDLGFDLGVDGSITEDAWWALLAMEKGYRTCWVDGYLDEQSTQSVMDFLKQRRRWYVGLWKVSVHCPVSLKYRFFVTFTTVSWIIIPVLLPFIVIYMSFLCVHQYPVPFFLRILTNFIISTTMLVYLNGIVANMREHKTPWWRGAGWLLLLMILLPFFYLLEALSVLMAFFYPFSSNAKGFHVVQKSASTTARSSMEFEGSSDDKDGNASSSSEERSSAEESPQLP